MSIDSNGKSTIILKNVQSILHSDQSYSNHGVFLSFKFSSFQSQHDLLLGKLLHGNILSFSRIKRWWMAPHFTSSIDNLPVETQLLLVEYSNHNNIFTKNLNHKHEKSYAVIVPLIDYSSGFRTTFYGKDGNKNLQSGLLGARLESGDDNVRASVILDAIYISSGTNPNQLIESAYNDISSKMKTFRTRKMKNNPKGLDNFGFCTWDAFYSSVDSDKVMKGVSSLINIGIPPKFVIVDDGWQTVHIDSRIDNKIDKINSSLLPATIPIDGELSGAQIDGNIAKNTDIFSQNSNIVVKLLTNLASDFYINVVEKGSIDDCTVKLWKYLSNTILKNKLIDFYNQKTDFSKRLITWKANKKFEDIESGKTLKKFIHTLKSDYKIEFVYFWHALSGYWGGVSENSNDDFNNALNVISNASDHNTNSTSSSNDNTLTAISNLLNPLIKGNNINNQSVQRKYSKPTPHLLQIEPALAWDPSSIIGVGSVAINKLDEMYHKIHAYLADSGADGVKVDAQSGVSIFGSGNGGGSALAQACVQAMEKSVVNTFGKLNQTEVIATTLLGKIKKYVNLSSKYIARWLKYDNTKVGDSAMTLEGCMCHSTENLYNFFETSLIRGSDDFYPKDLPSQTVHLVSCAFNSIMLSEFAITDWDMFQSNHPYAEIHAAARAISGGPVYVSDSPGNHNVELLKRVVLPDGHVLRCEQPAKPTIDCMFRNVMEDGETALKIWSTNKVSGVIGVFNTQGATWDRKTRRYITIPSTSPFVVTSIRPSDIDGDFAYKIQSTKSKYKDQSLYNRHHLTNRQETGSFIAWSAKYKKMYLLQSSESDLEMSLGNKDWDVISLSHLYRIDRHHTKHQHSMNTFGLGSLLKSIIRPFMSINTKLELKQLYKNRLLSHTHKDIFFSPIGLIDMINTGGSIDSVDIDNQIAEIYAKGVGDFGIYMNILPKTISVDNNVIPFTYDNYESINESVREHGLIESPRGYLVHFHLQSKKANENTLKLKKIAIRW